MTLKEKYINDASKLNLLKDFSGSKRCGWQSPSNIALVKYWGKKKDQIPQNASLSFTLKNSFSEITIDYSFANNSGLKLTFEFEGKENPAFEKRIVSYLNSITCYLPFLPQLSLEIRSNNSFPHSSGIASSASAMSALALCLVEIENELFGTLDDTEEFFEKASFLARLGSGSAARSVYGGYVLWGENVTIPNSTNECGVKFNLSENNSFNQIRDAILITSKSKKSISSSQGHGMMFGHPYADTRYSQAKTNLTDLIQSLVVENEEKFIDIIENEALSLHALMLSSFPGYNLLNENTWKIINKIREYRENSGITVTFTLDAGPNVHLIYLEKNKKEVKAFIEAELKTFCEDGYWINDGIGEGPQKIRELSW